LKFDIAEFEEPEPSVPPDKIKAGSLYELKATRNGETGLVEIKKVYYIKECLQDGSFKVILKNNSSNWSDQLAILYRKSSRKINPEIDLLSLDCKDVRELSKKESKDYVDKNLKSWEIRKSFGLKPIKRRTPLGHIEEVTYT
jgi:hypothetical protein